MTSSGWSIQAPEQLLSIFGSILILFAYALTVAMPERRRLYCSISLLGGVLLLMVAVIYRNVGLILLEVAWIGINAWGILKGSKAITE